MRQDFLKAQSLFYAVVFFWLSGCGNQLVFSGNAQGDGGGISVVAGTGTNPGAGLNANSQFVRFTIADGTSTGAWNPSSNPVHLRVGDVLIVCNLDATANVQHSLHADGSILQGSPNIQVNQCQDYIARAVYSDTGEIYDGSNGVSAAFHVFIESD